MGIFSIRRDWGFSPSIVRIATTDDIATVSTIGYLLTQTQQIQDINGGAFEWSTTDFVLLYSSDSGGLWDFFTYDPTTQSLVPTPGSIITVPVPIAQGGTGATTASGARTNLGLGTMATQDASSVAITGGVIDGVALGSGVTGLPVPSGLNATGTPDNTTFLRGDGAWAVPAGGGVTSTQVQQSAFNHGTDTGTSTVYAVALNPAIVSYTDGLLVSFTPANTNTDNFPSLNVNGIGAIQIIINAGESACSIGDLNTNFEAQLIYSATTAQFILLNPQVTVPVLRDMLTGNGYWTGIDQGVAPNVYGMNLAANTASGANQFNPLFAVLTFPNATNTGASTLTFANAGPFAILDSKGNALVGGEIVQFKTAFMVFDGSSSYLLMNSAL